MRSAISWILRLIVAVILLQTLFFKFTAAPEAVHIFSTLGVEPWGRWATGLLELATALLVLVPPTVSYGALLGVLLMLGAVGSHFTALGIEVMDDGGLLFGMGIVVLVSSLILLYLHGLPLLGRHSRPGSR